jgi:phosphoglycerate kinase
MYRSLTGVKLDGKKVLLRAGFDLPMTDGIVTDASRVDAVVPTMKHILESGAALIIMAHQDRPKGKVVPEMSQRPLVKLLEERLGTQVFFADSATGEETKRRVDDLQPGQVMLLENLRFDPREEKNDVTFARELAAYAQVYVNDAFSNSHRKHASMVAVAGMIPSYMGLHLEKEVTNLQSVTENPRRPLALIISGAKVETKVPVINRFMERGDDILPGGAIANTFIAADGKNIAASLVDSDLIPEAKKMLTQSRSGGVARIHIPTDAVVAADSSAANGKVVRTDSVPEGTAIFDLGPETVDAYVKVLLDAQSIVWNGPLGMYEKKPFAGSSKIISKELMNASARGATVIIGGGDTLDFLANENIDLSSFTFVSTGGGAMLDFLADGTLPALEALRS